MGKEITLPKPAHEKRKYVYVGESDINRAGITSL